MLGHLDAWLERQDADRLPIDKILVDQTRAVLAQMPLQNRVYNFVKAELGRSKLPEFSVTAVGGVQAPQVLMRKSGEPLTRGVPGTFSVAGYKKFQELNLQAVAEVAKDSWVLAQQEKAMEPAKIEQIKVAVQELYFADYIKVWDQFLADVTIQSFATLDQGARLTTILTGAESPLKKFLVAAARETALEGVAKVGGEATSKAIKDKLNQVKSKIGGVFGAVADDAVAANAQVRVTNPVDLHFERLHRLVGQPIGGTPGAAGAAGAAGARRGGWRGRTAGRYAGRHERRVGVFAGSQQCQAKWRPGPGR